MPAKLDGQLYSHQCSQHSCSVQNLEKAAPNKKTQLPTALLTLIVSETKVILSAYPNYGPGAKMQSLRIIWRPWLLPSVASPRQASE